MLLNASSLASWLHPSRFLLTFFLLLARFIIHHASGFFSFSLLRFSPARASSFLVRASAAQRHQASSFTPQAAFSHVRSHTPSSANSEARALCASVTTEHWH
jgi:hypothetical protein